MHTDTDTPTDTQTDGQTHTDTLTTHSNQLRLISVRENKCVALAAVLKQFRSAVSVNQ